MAFSVSQLLMGGDGLGTMDRQVESIKYSLQWSNDSEYILQEAQRFVEQYPKEYIGHVLLAQAYQKNKQLDFALKEIDLAIKMNKSNFDTHFLRLEILYESRKYSEVILGGKAIVDRFDAPGKVFELLGKAFQNIGKFDESIVCYEKAIALGGTTQEIHTNLFEVKRVQYEKQHEVKSMEVLPESKKSAKIFTGKKNKKHS